MLQIKVQKVFSLYKSFDLKISKVEMDTKIGNVCNTYW